MEIAAWLGTALLFVLAVFQLALAFGAPFGEAAWGGAHAGVLPTRLRIASGFAALVYAPISIVLLESAGVLDLGWDVQPVWLWVLAGFFALGTVSNLVSRSKIERLWAIESAALAACCVIIATGM